MKIIIKLADLSKSLWKDGSNNIYQEINGFMYPYNPFQNQILNQEIKLPLDQFSKLEPESVVPRATTRSKDSFQSYQDGLSLDQRNKPISIVNDQKLMENILDSGS